MNKKEKTSELNLTTRRRSYRKRTIKFRGRFYRLNGIEREFDCVVAGDRLITKLTCPNHPQRAYGQWELEVADVVPCKDYEDLVYMTCFLRYNYSPHDLRKVVFITLFAYPDGRGWIHSICHMEREKRRK
ncbi:MAG: hypothetical protein HOA57_02430 [Candidatus Magasanikbacteria bacterium]|jgi:hypothetical protein|nr:hypothetical protein [Candidatus Magasanikbacteria bacterium]MBT4314918.1 hypothetical protein [Candidatus Magasanikbacteria bacterium]MBT4546874.1 hypothetical protein [Candidatus Magasanikbacteria bacterium]MBT6819212.1 hypothetical protein [Candidatus Magasanikbacteria bacterium]